MVIPPCYSDLGKCASNLFDKNFNSGFAKIDIKTKCNNGFEFLSKGSYEINTGRIFSAFDGKFVHPQTGLSIIGKCSTGNEITGEVLFIPKSMVGAQFNVSGTLSPWTGKKSGFIKAMYKRNFVNTSVDMSCIQDRPVLNSSGVLCSDDIIAGYDVGFDVRNSSFCKKNVAIGVTGPDYRCVFNCNNEAEGMELGAILFHSVTSKFSSAVKLLWSYGQANVRFGLAAQYRIDGTSSANVKINNAGQLGFAYTLLVRKGLRLTTSTVIEARNIDSGGHKVGFGLEFEI